MEQHFTYAWDEVNRIHHARRFDRANGASWELAVEQRSLYDASNQRTVKTTTFRGLESGAERTALYVYPGDYERRGLQRSMGGTSYEAISGDTETQYGVGGARIVWRTGTRNDDLDRNQRITIALTDLIQSATAVIDLATGEIVETGSYYANGARETYRSNESEAVTPEPMGFTGKEADEEVGLTYFGQRYLMAHLGRWASPDPLQTHAVGGGEALNGYHYVSGNVLQARDPDGLDLIANVTVGRVAGMLHRLGLARVASWMRNVHDLAANSWTSDTEQPHWTTATNSVCVGRAIGDTNLDDETLGLPIDALVEELTHGFMDVYSDQAVAVSIRVAGRSHYERAIMADGRITDDPERVFQEAVGQYVAHRVQTFYSVRDRLGAARARGTLTPELYASLRAQYDRAMAERVFGYDEGSGERPTITAMPEPMRREIDQRLLGGQIPDRFDDIEVFRAFDPSARDTEPTPTAGETPAIDQEKGVD